MEYRDESLHLNHRGNPYGGEPCEYERRRDIELAYAHLGRNRNRSPFVLDVHHHRHAEHVWGICQWVHL